jgi:hypothetical protein
MCHAEPAALKSKRVGRRSEAAACSWRYAAVTGTPNTNLDAQPCRKLACGNNKSISFGFGFVSPSTH